MKCTYRCTSAVILCAAAFVAGCLSTGVVKNDTPLAPGGKDVGYLLAAGILDSRVPNRPSASNWESSP